MNRRGILVLAAALAACSQRGGSTTSTSSTADASAPTVKSAYLPPRPGDAIQGLFAIANPESEAARRGYEARIAAAKTETEARSVRMEAALNADFLPTQATVRGGRLVLRRGLKVVLDTAYRVESEDPAGVNVVLDVDGGAPCRLDRIAPDTLRVPSLEGIAGGAIWVRRVVRD
ncbi:MAG: hypothetical protein ABJE95_02795 [Byssovorax sp.]